MNAIIFNRGQEYYAANIFINGNNQYEFDIHYFINGDNDFDDHYKLNSGRGIVSTQDAEILEIYE